MNAPCRNCPNRQPLCHMGCAEYIQFTEQRKEIYQGKIDKCDYLDAKYTALMKRVRHAHIRKGK